MSPEKRQRCVNFTTEEKMRFLRILQEKGKAIVSKVDAYDLTSKELKEKEWADITKDLNASGRLSRTSYNLKILWKRMKVAAKDHKLGDASDPILDLVAKITSGGNFGVDSVEDGDHAEQDETAKADENVKHGLSLQSNENNGKHKWLNKALAVERLKCEGAKRSLIVLKKQQMVEEHELKMKQGQLKTKMMEVILQKIRDDKTVNPELIKIILDV